MDGWIDVFMYDLNVITWINFTTNFILKFKKSTIFFPKCVYIVDVYALKKNIFFNGPKFNALRKKKSKCVVTEGV